eukprot:scaffold4196_cov245-Pinguiococcus_pyrenoidosus.AAC.4
MPKQATEQLHRSRRKEAGLRDDLHLVENREQVSQVGQGQASLYLTPRRVHTFRNVGIFRLTKSSRALLASSANLLVQPAHEGAGSLNASSDKVGAAPRAHAFDRRLEQEMQYPDHDAWRTVASFPFERLFDHRAPLHFLLRPVDMKGEHVVFKSVQHAEQQVCGALSSLCEGQDNLEDVFFRRPRIVNLHELHEQNR